MSSAAGSDPGIAPSNVVIIACDVLREELQNICAGLAAPPTIEYLQQGLHNTPAELRIQLQSAVTRIENNQPSIQFVALAYGLCSRGVEGVTSSRCKLIVPRAHDCITLLLGDRTAYSQYVEKHPGTYWYSPGWIRCHTPPGPERWQKLKDEYTRKFGEEDAAFLLEQEQSWFKTYSRAAYIDQGAAKDLDADLQTTQSCANWLGWEFDRVAGDSTLLRKLLTGDWDDQTFLTLSPGQTAHMSADDNVITAVSVNGQPLEKERP